MIQNPFVKKDSAAKNAAVEAKSQVDKKFQEKKNIRHAILALIIGTLTTMGWMVGDYAFSKILDQKTFIFLGVVLVFLIVVYIAVTAFEFSIHYSDMAYYNRTAMPKSIEIMINKAFEEIKTTAISKADAVIQQVVDTGIMKYLETTAKYIEAINATNTNPIETITKDPKVLTSTEKTIGAIEKVVADIEKQNTPTT